MSNLLQNLSHTCAGAAACYDGVFVGTTCATPCVKAWYMKPCCYISKVCSIAVDSCLTVSQSSHPLLLQVLKANGAGNFSTGNIQLMDG